MKAKDNLAAIDLLDQKKKNKRGNKLNALSAMEKGKYQETLHKKIDIILLK